MKEGKSFEISQQLVLEAYKRVKANHGAPGIDGEDFASFEKDLKNNLYKLWNRMVSGSYFPKCKYRFLRATLSELVEPLHREALSQFVALA